MSQILITGMSAPQYSEGVNAKSLSFSGVMSKVLTDSGHTVTQKAPDVLWTARDFSRYDVVLVGLSPLTSISSNYIYGALMAIHTLKDTGKLRLFVDAPEPSRIFGSLRAVSKNPSNLTKPFFSYRKGYDVASQSNVSHVLIEVVNQLLENEWPVTLYPSVPWDGYQSLVHDQFPEQTRKSLRAVSLDSYLLADESFKAPLVTLGWTCDDMSTKWSKQAAASVSTYVLPMRWHKNVDDDAVFLNIASSIGALISPAYSGTWWSYRLIQSLNAGVPVATDWIESVFLGYEWSYLPAAIEDMSESERRTLAARQVKSYAARVPSKNEAIKMLEQVLGIKSLLHEGSR
jgi:hypothetical protein